jgi:flavodoxin
MMNALVVYDSQFGNTEQIAEAVADALRAFGPVQALRVSEARPSEVENADLLVVGSPTQGWRPTPATQSFLDKVVSDRPDLVVACFDTRFRKPTWLLGSAAENMDKYLREKGVEPIVEPESFFVKGKKGPLLDGELENATTWAVDVYQQYQSRQPQVVAR